MNINALNAANKLHQMGFSSACASGDGVHLDADDAAKMAGVLDSFGYTRHKMGCGARRGRSCDCPGGVMAVNSMNKQYCAFHITGGDNKLSCGGDKNV